MKTVCYIAIVIGLCLPAASSQDKPERTKLGSSIQVEFPHGDVRITFVESREGMVLRADCDGVSVQAQRLYLGDGKVAVQYEALTSGFYTPNGKVNAAAIEFKKSTTINVPPGVIEKWGTRRGEVYVNTPSLHFKATDE